LKNNTNIQIIDGKKRICVLLLVVKQRKFWQHSALEWRLATRISRRLCDWFNQLSITRDLLRRVVAVKHIICCVKWISPREKDQARPSPRKHTTLVNFCMSGTEDPVAGQRPFSILYS